MNYKYLSVLHNQKQKGNVNLLERRDTSVSWLIGFGSIEKEKSNYYNGC